MAKFAKTQNGRGWVVWSDNIEEETMDLINIDDCDSSGNYDLEWVSCTNYKYCDIVDIDTNRHVLGI